MDSIKTKVKKVKKINKVKKNIELPVSKDVVIENISIAVPNKTLIEKSDIRIAYGRRYAVVGVNGSGKTTLLKKLANDDLGVKIDRYYVEQEVKASDTETVFETVLKSNENRFRLLQNLKDVEAELEKSETTELLSEYDSLIEKTEYMEIDKDESKIRKILSGLGFSVEEQNTPTSHFSGGWRMRMSLARALYLHPSLLLLDEPTNHLDLNATIWLTNYLTKWKNSLVIVSHDREFINETCTDIIHLYEQKLKYYSTKKNRIYDSFKNQFENDLKHQQKEYTKTMKQVKVLQNKSTPKAQIDEFIKKEGVQRPPKPYLIKIKFPDVARLELPIIELHCVDFGYSKDNILYKNIEFGIDQDSRITLVGRNGIGKSTLLKLISKELTPINGSNKILYNRKVRIGYYHQHSIDVLPLDITPIKYIHSLDSTLKEEDIRKMLGDIGLEGKIHTQKIGDLSGGQKSRVSFVAVTVLKPHILLFDEPTNHLDIETVDALCDAINSFNGGVVMVTHDVDLILKTDSVLWEVKKKGIIETDYETYRDAIIEDIEDTT